MYLYIVNFLIMNELGAFASLSVNKSSFKYRREKDFLSTPDIMYFFYAGN
jgi:hypothetical protein